MEFSKSLHEKTYNQYENLIKDYNKLIDKYDFQNKLKKFMDANKNRIKEYDRFKSDMISEFGKITLNT